MSAAGQAEIAGESAGESAGEGAGGNLDGISTFCLGQPEIVVVPVEAWGPGEPAAARLSPAGRSLLGRAGLASSWVDRFEAAHVLFQERTTSLSTRAPRTWASPRLGNVVVIRRGVRTRPFTQPLPRASWVIDETDLDEATGSRELGAYALCHAERMGFVGDAARAHLACLGWWLVSTDASIEDFVAGAGRCQRTDARVLSVLADAMPWLRALHEPALRPPPSDPALLAHIPDTEILVGEHLEPSVRALSSALGEAAREAARAVRAEQRAAPATAIAKRLRPIELLLDWLRKERPRLVVAGARGETLWEPDAAGHTGPLRTLLDKAPHRAVASLHDDLRIVDARSRTFLERVVDRAALPRSSEAVDPDGGVWIDPRRQLISYSLVQPGLTATEEPAPPFHRWLLGARVAHEWAHLVESAGWVAIAPEREAEHGSAMLAYAQSFEGIVQDAPQHLREIAATEANLLGREPGETAGAVFARKTMDRVGDFRANLVAKEVLPPEELESYARVNARTHALAGLGPFAQLMRHTIEVRYLALASGPDPYAYLFRSTFFDAHFAAVGLADRASAASLFEAARRVLDCWAIDRNRFRAP